MESKPELFEELGVEPAPPETSAKSSQRRALDVADDMVLEYVAFRGFTETFRSFSMERFEDSRSRGTFEARFAVEALLRPLRDLDGVSLVESWEFIESKFLVQQLDSELASHADALRSGLFRYFCVTAVVRREPQKAVDLLADLARRDATERRTTSFDDRDDKPVWAFEEEDDGLDYYRSQARNGTKWREWFAMPFLTEPHKDPAFKLYFSKSWQDSFQLSLRNFLATIFARAPPPKLLLLEKWHRSSAQRALRTALDAAKTDNADLRQSLARAAQSRDALAATLKALVAHCHHESLRDSARLQRGGLFDEDPQDALRLARDAGAAALDLAKKCDISTAAFRPQLDNDPAPNRDTQLLALCDATKAYLDLLRGTTLSAAAASSKESLAASLGDPPAAPSSDGGLLSTAPGGGGDQFAGGASRRPALHNSAHSL